MDAYTAVLMGPFLGQAMLGVGGGPAGVQRGDLQRARPGRGALHRRLADGGDLSRSACSSTARPSTSPRSAMPASSTSATPATATPCPASSGSPCTPARSSTRWRPRSGCGVRRLAPAVRVGARGRSCWVLAVLWPPAPRLAGAGRRTTPARRAGRPQARIDQLEADLVHRAATPAAPQLTERAVARVVEAASKVREHGSPGCCSPRSRTSRRGPPRRSRRSSMADSEGRVTLLFSDIEDSTPLNERLGDDTWVRVLAAHDSLVRDRVDRYRGQVVKTSGDGFMVAFRDAEAACRAAVGIQKDLRRTLDPMLRLVAPVKVRIGIHTGRSSPATATTSVATSRWPPASAPSPPAVRCSPPPPCTSARRRRRRRARRDGRGRAEGAAGHPHGLPGGDAVSAPCGRAPCPCGRGASYDACCGRLHRGAARAATPGGADALALRGLRRRRRAATPTSSAPGTPARGPTTSTTDPGLRVDRAARPARRGGPGGVRGAYTCGGVRPACCTSAAGSSGGPAAGSTSRRARRRRLVGGTPTPGSSARTRKSSARSSACALGARCARRRAPPGRRRATAPSRARTPPRPSAPGARPARRR